MTEARRLVLRREARARFVPFASYHPTYDAMTVAQQQWYFHWRDQVRRGSYPDTDSSYVFVHVYELINGVGAGDVADAYDQLHRLWLNYRERHPKVGERLLPWLADFACLHRCREDPLEVYQEALEAGAEPPEPDLLLARYVASPEKMPLALIEALGDYRPRKSKFHNEGNEALVAEQLPQTLARVDEHLRQKSGGILERFGLPPAPLRRQPFQGALYATPATEIELAKVPPYSQHQPLCGFLTALVKYTENRLREARDYGGRLRGYSLDPEIQAVIDAAIAAACRGGVPPPPRQRIVIDLAKAQALQSESDQVREMLLAGGEARTGKVERATQDAALAGAPTAGVSLHQPSDLDSVGRLLGRLGHQEVRLLEALRSGGWEMDADALAQALPDLPLEHTVDHINAHSLEWLGDTLIACEGDRCLLTDDFRDELEVLLARPPLEPEATGAADGLPAGWQEFAQQLDGCQLEALRAICEEADPSQAINRIAEANMTMPQFLIDSINQVALDTVGDIVIQPDSDPPAIEEEDLEMVRQVISEA